MITRNNKEVKKKSFVYKGAVVLSTIVIFGVSTKIVYSDPQFDISVKYLEDIYDPQISIFDPQNNRNHKWYFKEEEDGNARISFEVDFSEYYKKAIESNSITKEEKDIPFAVVAKVVRGNEIYDVLIEDKDITIVEVKSENNEFEGKYNVTIAVPDGENGDNVNIEIRAVENNKWGLPSGISEKFNITRDNEIPKIILDNISKGDIVKDNILVSLSDNYLDTTEMTVDLNIDGEKSNNNDNYYQNGQLIIDTSKDGHYTGIIKAKDKAGNIAEEKTIDFFVNNNGPSIKFNGKEKEDYYSTKSIEVLIENDSDIDFEKSKYKLYNISDSSKVVDIPKESIIKQNNKSIKLKLNIKEDGKYKLVPEIYNVGGILNNINSEDYVFEVDTKKPNITISGIDKNKSIYNENKNIKFTVDEKNLESINVKLNNEVIDKSKLIEEKKENGKTIYSYKTEVEEGVNKKLDFTVTAKDKAGLESNVEKLSFTIDRKKPTVEFIGVDNNSYYKENKEVTIQVKDEYLKDSNISIKVKEEIEGEDTQEKTYTSENSKLKNGKLTIPFNKEGKYSIQVSAKDNNGNSISAKEGNINFVIDKTKPKINIDKANEYNAEEDFLKFTVDENNFKQSDLKVIVNRTKPNSEPETFEVDEKYIKKISEKDGMCTFELEEVFEEDGEYNISINLEDKAKNLNNSGTSFIVDRTKPEVEIITAEDKGYHNDKEVNLQVRVKDNNHKENKVTIEKISENEEVNKEIYTDKLNSNNNNNQFVVENDEKVLEVDLKDEGTYNVTVESIDMAGNVNDKKETYSFVIDRENPIITTNFDTLNGVFNNSDEETTASIEIREENWKNKYTGKPLKAIVTGKRIDQINNKEESIDLSFDLESQTTKKDFINEFKKDGVYNLNVSITDFSGNTTDSQSVNFTIDSEKADIEILGVNEKEFCDRSKEVTIEVQDANNDNSNIVIMKDGEEYKIKENFVEEGNKRVLKHLFNENGKYQINVESTDKAQNKSNEYKEFTIDKQAPELKIVDANNGEEIKEGHYYNKLKNVDVILDDDNIDIDSCEIIVNGEKKEIGKYTAENGEENYKYTVETNKDGKYVISVKAKDLSGNALTEDNEAMVTSFIVDTTNPIVNIDNFDSLNKSFKKELKSIKVNIDESNFIRNNEEFNLDEEEIKSDDYESKIQVQLYIKKPNEVLKIITKKENELNIVQSKDENGKPIEGKYEFEMENLFDENAEYKLFIGMTDIAGNVVDNSSKNEVSFSIDNIKPDIKVVTPVEKKYYKDSEVPLEIRISDNNHDVNKVTIERAYKKIGEKEKIESTEYEEFSVEGNEKVFKKVLTEEGSYKVKVYSKDKVGNESTLEEYSFTIDRTNPVIETNFSSIDGSYSDKAKELNIKVSEVNWKNQYTDEILVAKVEGEKITPDNKVTPINLSFPLTGDVTVANYIDEFMDDGQYNLNVSIIDSSGLEGNSQSVKFVKDSVLPTISIEGVENDQHYNMDRYLVITNNDVNHDINNVTVKRNGAEYPVGDFLTEGRNKIIKHTFSQEGEYELSVSSTDKAGNTVTHPNIKFTIDKTAPVITPLNSNDNSVLQNGAYINKLFIPEFKLDKPEEDKIDVIEINGQGNFANSTLAADKEIEYKYKVIASDKAKNSTNLDIGFTVDVTPPEIKLEGIISGFFSKDMRPIYSITDKNLDKEKTSVTLNGVPFESGTLIQEQNNYNLKLIGTDLANNVSSKTISFTIDKDKPVIKFEEALSGKYFTEDFIPNFIIDDLSDYTIISMTLDGENYEVGEEIEEEGKHVLYIEVKDKAENIESVSLEFVLDKTPPKFIIDGVEDGGKYEEAVTATIKLENPKDKIKSIKVNGEVAEGKIKEIDGQEVAIIDFDGVNDYKIELVATDDAGNVTEETLNFELVDKNIFVRLYNNKGIFYPAIAAIGAMLMYFIFLIFKRSKDDEEEEEN